MTKLFRIILFVHPTPDYYNLHIHPAILTHGLESVLNIVPELKRLHLSALVYLKIVNTAHLTIYCYCTTPASKVHELLEITTLYTGPFLKRRKNQI